MSSDRTVSNHLLRRRARGLRDRLRRAQADVASHVPGNRVTGFREPTARVADGERLLDAFGVGVEEALRIERAERGPWRWRVVAS